MFCVLVLASGIWCEGRLVQDYVSHAIVQSQINKFCITVLHDKLNLLCMADVHDFYHSRAHRDGFHLNDKYFIFYLMVAMGTQKKCSVRSLIF